MNRNNHLIDPVTGRFKMLLKSLIAASLFVFEAVAELHTCTVPASGTNLTDDAPAIRAAFKECKEHSKIIFSPTTYFINSKLDIRGLEDVDIDIQGELLVCKT